MKISSIITVSGVLLLLLLFTGCTTDSGFNIQEPTFDDVEKEMFSIEGIESEPVVDGIIKYTIEEGPGEDSVVIRDQIAFYITLSIVKEDTTFIYSSYQNDNRSPIQATIQNILTPRPPNAVRSFTFDRARTDGLRKGLIGMREGEKRVIIVPPSQGFESISSGSINEQFRNETLRYDVKLDFIF